MQEDLQDIDLLVRSRIENAEIKAPKGVWRAVRSRLDESSALSTLEFSAPPSSSRRWRYIAAGLSFAAVVCAGLFFVGTFRQESARPGSSEAVALLAEELAPAPQTTVPALPVPDEGSLSSDTEARIGRLSATDDLEKVSEDDSMEAGVLMPDSPGEIDNEGIELQDEFLHRDYSSGDKAATDDASHFENESALWERIIAEDEKERSGSRRCRVLYAQGSLSGNDSNISASNFGRMAPSATGLNDIGITESSSSVYGVPFSIGAGARFYLTERFSLGAGLEYSVLTRTFSGMWSPDGLSSYMGDIFGKMRYLGIPLNAYYDVFCAGKDGSSSLKLYVFGGGEAECCISNTYSILSAPSSPVISEAVRGIQWSVGGGIGVEFRVSEHLGIFLDPGFRYYFNCAQPKSIRTDKPLMINIEAGLRFNIQ